MLSRLRVAVGGATRIYSMLCHRIFVAWQAFIPRRFRSWCPGKALSTATYLTLKEEKQYWLESDLYRRQLRFSDARFGRSKIQSESPLPLVTYYTPRLLPAYRSLTSADMDASPYHLSAKNFCKWHRMVAPGSVSLTLMSVRRILNAFPQTHLTLSAAKILMKNYSNRDLQEIYRISRLLSDEEVFQGRGLRTTRYSDMWTSWLDTKGPDIIIIFDKAT